MVDYNKIGIGFIVFVLLGLIGLLIAAIVWWKKGFEFFGDASKCKALTYDCWTQLYDQYYINFTLEWMHDNYHISFENGRFAVNSRPIPVTQSFSVQKFLDDYYTKGDKVYLNGKLYIE